MVRFPGRALFRVISALGGLLSAIRDRLPESLTAGGALKTDSSATVQPVSGTVGLTGPVTVGGTVAVSSVAGTVAISAVSLPLPSGAATDRALPTAPASVELSDGAAFYAAAKTGQLPAALVGGRLGVDAVMLSEQTEDHAHVPGGLLMAGAVRNDSNVSLVASDGANTPLQVNDRGALKVTVQSTVVLDVASLQLPASLAAHGALGIEGIAGGTPVPISGSVASDGNTADNAAFVDGTTKVTPAGFVLDEVAGTALTENDAAAARIDSKRAQVFVLEDATTRGQRATISAAGALKVDGSAVTQTVTGTVAVSGTVAMSAAALPLPSGASTETTLAAAAASLSVLDDWDESDRAKVNLIAGQAGVQGGSGVVTALTQRVVLATDVTPPLPSGAATETTLSALNAKVTAVNTGAVVVASGALTANAGTNLNTSLLALEAGGNLAAVAASASVLDDWDESDRCKSNPIVGQAGVQGGSGVATALTQRVVLATDVTPPLPNGAATETTLSALNAKVTAVNTGAVVLAAGSAAFGKLAANSGVIIGDVNITTAPNITLAASTNTNEVVGDVAHDAAAAGNPLLVCGIAQDTDDTAPPNRVSAEGDATRIATDRDGAAFTRLGGPQTWRYHEDSSSALSAATVHAAPGAGLSLYVTDVVFSTGAATACNVKLLESGTVVAGPWYLEAVAGRGLALHFITPLKVTPNTALTITSSAAIAHGVDIHGFIGQG